MNHKKVSATKILKTMLDLLAPCIILGHFICLLLFSTFCFCSALETNSSTDYVSLMAFKSHLLLQRDDELSRNWTSSTHFCSWYGVSCFNGRVTNLRLSGLAIHGELSPEIVNISELVELDLSSNNLGGSITGEVGFLQQLRILNVSNNSLHGTIPSNLSRCQYLQQLDLSYNFIAGSIPEELGLLRNLHALVLDHNNLTGTVPASFGNLTKLESLYLLENDLSGEIPERLGMLTSLTVLGLRGNNFTGQIPPSIFNISSLQIVDLSVNGFSGILPQNLGAHLPNLERLFLDSNRISGEVPIFLPNATKLNYLFLSENDLHGELPNELGSLINLIWFEFEYNQISGGIPYSLFNITSLENLRTRHNYLIGNLPHDLGNHLPNLQEIFLSHNQFSGEIPPSICNATKLVYLEVANNSFSGPVPMMLGNLVELDHLDLQNNLLSGNPQSTYLDFMNSLVNCRKLEFLILEFNPLNGIVPESVGNLSTNLKVFTAISCGLKGGIPPGIGNLSSLNYLGWSLNDLQGEVPSTFSSLQSLERIYLTNNNLEGPIPEVFCSIKMLGILHLGENRFSGAIPPCFENLTELRETSLAYNNLNSSIPSGFWHLVKLEGLNLSNSHLEGPLPDELGNLKALNILDLSSNAFSGEIPVSVGSLQSLLALDMSKNRFQGPIPSTLSNLIVIEDLDLSSNMLSGGIPESLGSLQDLVYLNLSFNMLQGEIPHTGIFKNMTNHQYLMGNPNLCGAPNLDFPLCSPQVSAQRKQKSSLALKIAIPIAATFLIVLCLLLCIRFRRKERMKKAIRSENLKLENQIITYDEILQATDGLRASNLLGKGSSGAVYKGDLSDGTIAAIKVFNLQYSKALKNFRAEIKVLNNVRHRNLVKVIATCSEFNFKAIVLEFVPNGSLESWLHSKDFSLNLEERLDIMIDVANAMEYLHHEFTVPIAHCDLKPSNVLLDQDMAGRVVDFGITKILAQDNQQIWTETLGTIGYIAPEYGLDGQVSTKGDVYSYGILLLETFTGKRPTDDMFHESFSLLQWVARSFPRALTEVVDQNLVDDVNSVEKGHAVPTWNEIEDLLVSIFRVAFLCLKHLPEERIDMRDVGSQLKKLKAGIRKNSDKYWLPPESDPPHESDCVLE